MMTALNMFPKGPIANTFMQEAILQLQARIIVSGLLQQEQYLRKLITDFVATPNPASLNHATLLFNQIQHPSTYLYNTMFRAYAASSDPQKTLTLYQQMHNHGSLPDNYTFPFLFKACSRLTNLKNGQEIHSQTLKHGFYCDLYVQNSLIHFYGSNAMITLANRVFNDMGYRDIATWTTLITCYANSHSIELARKLFDEMPQRSVVSYSAMIAACVRNNCFKDALQLFRELLRANMEPNESSIMGVVCSCANLGALDMGRWVYSYVCQKKGNFFDSRINTALIDMFFKCGSIKNALKVFHGAKEKYVGEWTALLTGLAMHGLGDELVEAFEDMVRSGVKPNSVTFVALLSGCSHSGLVNTGLAYFQRMKSHFGIEPAVEHFGCVVDLLGRAGLIEEAVQFIRVMPVEANAAIWGALLNACTVYNNVRIGELAARWLLNDEPWNGALYLSLMGLYRNVGRRDEWEKMKQEMKDLPRRKHPGCSLVEVNGVCYEFVAGDKLFPYTLEVCLNLGNIVLDDNEVNDCAIFQV